jgi:hypothetical protein
MFATNCITDCTRSQSQQLPIPQHPMPPILWPSLVLDQLLELAMETFCRSRANPWGNETDRADSDA